MRRWFICGVIPRSVACSKSPTTWPVALMLFRILDAIPVIDQRDVPVVCEVIGVLVLYLVGVRSQERIVDKEQGPASRYAYFQRNTVVRVAVDEVIAVSRLPPATPVFLCFFIRAGPSGIIQAGRNRICRGCDREQVNDHGFVPPDQLVVEHPFLIGRPMPE